MTTYTRLRLLGVSIECADEKAKELDKLTDIQREAVYLFIEGYSWGDISIRLGKSRTWAYDAVATKLRNMLYSCNETIKD